MKITIVAAGKIREKWISAGIEEYTKRLKRYCTVDIVEVADSPDTLSTELALSKEAEKILLKIKPGAFVVLLDPMGVTLDSIAFSGSFASWMERGGAEITFVIGSSRGVGREIKNRADLSLSISAMTFTHQMARLLLLEQCYRGFRIRNGEPYHK